MLIAEYCIPSRHTQQAHTNPGVVTTIFLDCMGSFLADCAILQYGVLIVRYGASEIEQQ